MVAPPLQRGHYPFFTFSDESESNVVPPPSSTFTLSMRQESDTPDSGHPSNSDEDFVVIEYPVNNSTSEQVVVGSCEPQGMAGDPPAESDTIVLNSETTPAKHSLNSVPH